MFTLSSGKVPFSRYGSWLLIIRLAEDKAPDGRPGFYICSSHAGQRLNLLRVVPWRDGAGVDVESEEQLTLLQLRDAGGGLIEFCLDEGSTLRLRGSGGLGLRLEIIPGFSEHYSVDAGRNTLSIGTERRYELELLHGATKADWIWNARPSEKRKSAVEISGAADGAWDAALDEFTSTWVPRKRLSFDAAAMHTRADLDQWLADMPEAPVAFSETRTMAAFINWASVLSPTGFMTRAGMLMSRTGMCNVWSWDSCFNAMATVRGRPDLAWDQLMLMVDRQDEFGAYADAVNDLGYSFTFTKPPIQGWTVREMVARNPASATTERLTIMLDSLERWTRWWMNHRRDKRLPLPYYLHGSDSGWDNGAMFDSGTPLAAPDLSAFLVIQMDVLADLAARLGRLEDAKHWRAEADELLKNLLRFLWKNDHFVALRVADGEVVESRSLQPFMAILLGTRLPVEVREHLIRGLDRFMTPHGLATEDPTSPEYSSYGYWRGPIWAPSTYIVVCGLEACGELTLAHRISEAFCRMCSRSGFGENFDALTGDSLCDPTYTWTASGFLLLSEKLLAWKA